MRRDLTDEIRAQLIGDSVQFLGGLSDAITREGSTREESGNGSGAMQVWKSPSTAALITVFFGGIFVAMINGCIQQSLQERELQHDVVTAFNTAQLELHNVTLDDQTKSGRDAMDLVGAIVGRTQDYITSQSPRFAHPRGNSAREKRVRELIDQQKETIRKAFNTEQSNWQAKHVGAGILLVYSYHNDQEVSDAWKELVAKVNAYRQFAVDLKPNMCNPQQWENRLWMEHETPIHEQVKNLKEKMHNARIAGPAGSPDVARIHELLSELGGQ